MPFSLMIDIYANKICWKIINTKIQCNGFNVYGLFPAFRFTNLFTLISALYQMLKPKLM